MHGRETTKWVSYCFIVVLNKDLGYRLASGIRQGITSVKVVAKFPNSRSDPAFLHSSILGTR